MELFYLHYTGDHQLKSISLYKIKNYKRVLTLSSNGNIKSQLFTWNWCHFAGMCMRKIFFSSGSDIILLTPEWREGEIISCIRPLSCHMLLYLECLMHKAAVASAGLDAEEQGSAFCALQGAGMESGWGKLCPCCSRLTLVTWMLWTGIRLFDQVNLAALWWVTGRVTASFLPLD